MRGSLLNENPDPKLNRKSSVYIAPEISKGNRFSEKSFVWALGGILYEIITGNPPNPAFLELPAELSETVKDLIISMLQVDEEKRLSMRQLAKHPWLTGSFTYQRLIVTMEKMSMETETENFDAKLWYPQTDEYFMKQYGLIMSYLDNTLKKTKKI